METIDFDELGARAYSLRLTDKRAAGEILTQVKQYIAENPESSPLWTHWVRKHNFNWTQARRCVRIFSAEAEARLFPYTRKKAPVAAVIPVGEIHEAVLGFRAMMTKAEAEADVAKAEKRRVVAFQHFKFLLERSSLPELMKMSSDQIITLLRKL